MKSVPYAPVVGSLMYVMVANRQAQSVPYAPAVGVISRFMHNPSQPHSIVVTHIFRYLISTQDFGIHFRLNEPSSLVGFTDSDFVGCLDC